MAQSGTISVHIESVDNTGGIASGTCQDASNLSSFTRGHYTVTPTINWSINDNNQISFTWGGYTGDSSWWVCTTTGYHLDVQFSPNGTTWTTIASAFLNNSNTQPCPGTYDCSCNTAYKTYIMCQDLVAQLTPTQLTQSGYLRIYTWTSAACPDSTTDPGTIGVDVFPYAYPTASASEAVAVPVFIELDYRPGATWNGTNFMSHNRNGGVANVWNGNVWQEMRTEGAPTGKGNPPLIYRDGDWYNMAKLGQE